MRPKVHFTKTIQAVLLLALIAILSACDSKEKQLFIFYRQNAETHKWEYYKTDIANPSYIKKIDTTPCSDEKRHIIWSPNGNYYICRGYSDHPNFIYDVINDKVVITSNTWVFGKWSPDSQYTSIINTGSKEKPYYDFSVMKLDGTIIPIYQDLAAVFYDFAWSPNGKYIALEITPPYRPGENNGQSVLAIFDISGKRIVQFDLSRYIHTPVIIVNDIRWSPDGQKLVFYYMRSAYKQSQMVVLDIASEEAMGIISDKSICVDGISDWSPDGKKILFYALDCENLLSSYPIYYSVNADGSSLTQLTEEGIGLLDWTLDGKSFIGSGYGENRIYLMNVDGNNKRKLLENGSFVSWITP